MLESQDKKGFLEKPTSRREFLKFGAQGVAGAAVSLSLLNLFTNSANAKGMALSKGLLISEPHRCTGCRRCETLCTITNDGKSQPYISRVKVGRNYNFGSEVKVAYANSDGQYGNFMMNPDTCKQCADPVPCAEACPMDAIYADNRTGARKVDEQKCIGCGMCVQACPWAVITVDPQEQKAKKCFLCDGDPACAANCPTGALRLIPWKQVAAVVRKHRSLV